MAKLTKADAKKHAEACQLLAKEKLSLVEKEFVLENWREDANHINSAGGAFFTPPALARDFSVEATGPRVIDLCAGIGNLAFAVWHRYDLTHITCVEINPDYIAVGKKILPEATWIQADIFALPQDIGHFDCAIANPPFGATKASGKAPRFSGRLFEYRVIDIAGDLADYGVFIIPQTSAPFEYSGKPCYRSTVQDRYTNFVQQTAITLGANCGIDTSVHRNDWTIIPPPVEIVTADFLEARAARRLKEASSETKSSSYQESPVFREAEGRKDELGQRQLDLF